MTVTHVLHQKDLATISELIRKREVSPVEIVTELLERIDQIDPILNTIITLDRDAALEKARLAEEELNQGKYRGPLHGVPIGIKDLIFTKGIKTTMGSEIYAEFIPTENAFVIDQLETAGAIIFGKLNTHQFAYGPTGDRSYYGPVRNPYDITKIPGGSSSGSAASVAACLNYGALGTDTGGSIRVPAAFCGIVGMKPTYGRVSKRGVFPLAWTLDHTGPMTRTVTDNALMLNAISGYDAKDVDAIKIEREDFTRYLGKDIKGKVIGIPTRFFNEYADQDIKLRIKHIADLLADLGAYIIDVDIPDMEPIEQAQRAIIRSEAYAIHEQHLKDHPDKWDSEVKERLYTGLDVTGYEVARAHQTRKQMRQEYHSIFRQVDALLTPTTTIFPPAINERYLGGEMNDESHIRWTILKYTSPFNLLGLPAISIPVGFSMAGMPIGAQLIGPDFSEATLYQIAYALEQMLQIPTAKSDMTTE